MKTRHILVVLALLLGLWLLASCGGETPPPEQPAGCSHSLTHHGAVEATCGGPGNVEYWACANCGGYFADAAGSTEITDKDSVTLEALPHSLSHHTAVEATCGSAGNIKYFSCVNCGACFLDSEAGLDISNSDAVVLPQLAHPFVMEYNETEHWGSYTCAHGLPAVAATPHTLDDALCCIGCGFQTGTPGMEYTLNKDGESYTLYYMGAVTGDVVVPSFYNGKPVTMIESVAFNSTLTSVRIPDTVTVILGGTFRGCSNLTSVTLPSGIKRIYDDAFAECDSLGAVYMSDPEAWYKIQFDSPTANPMNGGATLYLNGEPLTELVVPSTVTAIGNYTFYNCDTLTSVRLPLSVESIGNSTFYGCSELVSVEISPTVAAIGEQAFMDCYDLHTVTVPARVEAIGTAAFRACVKLESVTFAKNSYLTELPAYAFYDCFCLKTVIFEPNSSLQCVGYYAFYECDSMTAVTFSSAVRELRGHAFENCEELVTLTLHATEIEIGQDTFKRCTGLIQREGGVHYVNQWAVGYDADVTNVTLRPDTVTVAYGAFLECRSLASITLPDSVTTIGPSAFEGCWALTSFKVPPRITQVQGQTFQGCSRLASVMIPASVTRIDFDAFDGCGGLNSVVFEESEDWWESEYMPTGVGTWADLISTGWADRVSANVLADPTTAAKHLTDNAADCAWGRVSD